MPRSSSRFLIAGVAALGMAAFGAQPGLASGSADSGVQAQPTSTVSAPRTANPNRQVCNTTRITGSRFQRRICRTAAEREAAEKETQDTTRDWLINESVDPTPGGESIGPGRLGAPTPN